MVSRAARLWESVASCRKAGLGMGGVSPREMMSRSLKKRIQEGEVWQRRRGGPRADDLCQVYHPSLLTLGTSSVFLCTRLVSTYVWELSEQTEAS